jgi:tagatose-6-phosphate ketose/aldose isomerase
MVYLVSPNPDVQRYEKDLIKQVKSNNNVKASVIVCFCKPDIDPSCYSLCIEIGLPLELPVCYGCVSYVFVGQMLGFFKSIERGLCPDSPSVSGNISRVVEGVILYD